MERLRRILTYFRVMFPLPVNLPAAVVMFGSFHLMAQATGGVEVRVAGEALFGLATIFLAMLLTRLLDELKDEEVDPELFPDRPLVTGAVRYSDVRLLALGCILGLLALNLGRGLATEVFLVFFVFLVLSWQWWMFPDVVPGRNWLVLVTHQPLVPLLCAYMYAVTVETTPLLPDAATATALCAVYWLPMFAWEIGRKVRAPEEETAYLTYSRRWGTRVAASLPLAALLLAGGGMVALGAWKGFSTAFLCYHALLSLLLGGGIARFIRRPCRATARVRPLVEAYILLFHAGTIGEIVWRTGPEVRF